MKQLKKYVVPVNIICYGENESDSTIYVEEALDNSAFIHEDGIIGVEVIHDDIEPYDEGDTDDREFEED